MKKRRAVGRSVWSTKRRSAPALLVLFVLSVAVAFELQTRAAVDLSALVAFPSAPKRAREQTVPRIFDGQLTAKIPLSRFSVVLDNLAEGRPQAGINAAGLVIEAPAEAGITRWLAFFEFNCTATGGTASSCQSEAIGPVRSLRPYFLELAEGYRTPIAHVGGSPEALAEAKKSRLLTVNEFSFGRFFFRDRQRVDPHRVFTSVGLLSGVLEQVGVSFPALAMPWTWQQRSRQRIVRAPSGGGSSGQGASAIASFRFVNYPPPPETELSWSYNPETRLFERATGGALQRDVSGAVISAKTVFVVETSIVITDAIGRRRITTTGTGTAWQLTSSGRERLIWTRRAGEPFSFVRPDRTGLELEPGRVWITIVPSGQKVVDE